MYDAIIDACQFLLYNIPIANNTLTYLSHRLDRRAQEQFKFGFLPSSDYLNTLLSLLNEEELLKTNIIYKKTIDDQERLISILDHHNLILPYRDVYGNIIALVGRSLLNDEERQSQGIAKYKNTSFEKSKHLFGLFETKREIARQQYAIIVEGQFDCIQAYNKGLKTVVALGSSGMSFGQLALLLRYTNNIKLLLDNDEAGKAGSEKIISKFGKYAKIKNYCLPAGFKDVDEFLKDNSVEELTTLLN